MIPPFDKKTGYLLAGYHKATLQEFEKRFVIDFPSSKTRKDIIEDYKGHCKEIISTQLAEKQWVDGSYITTKPNPDDIEILTVVDGVEMDSRCFETEMDRIIYDAPLRTGLRCHSFYVARYPKEMKDEYETYVAARAKYLGVCWNSDDEYTLKGIVEMDLSTI